MHGFAVGGGYVEELPWHGIGGRTGFTMGRRGGVVNYVSKSSLLALSIPNDGLPSVLAARTAFSRRSLAPGRICTVQAIAGVFFSPLTFAFRRNGEWLVFLYIRVCVSECPSDPSTANKVFIYDLI